MSLQFSRKSTHNVTKSAEFKYYVILTILPCPNFESENFVYNIHIYFKILLIMPNTKSVFQFSKSVRNNLSQAFPLFLN